MIEDVDSRARARVGSVLDDKWTLEKLLGVGGMAAVYAARHRNGARAAVKVLHPSLARHKEVRERFLREGYAANRVEHAGVVKVLDDDVVSGGPDANTAYLVMELLEGESLQDRLERGRSLAELEFLEIADGVLEVLEAAHARGVVHRDLKPENLFLLRDEGAAGDHPPRVKVLDFGLARLLQGQAITSYGLALGTPSFMSPEQAAGRIDEIDGRTDLFALAATGFRVRAGRRIHEAGNAVELVTKMSSMAAPRLRDVAPDASVPYARVIDRALEFRREDRYESAAAMLKDVRRAIAEIAARPAPDTAVPGDLAAGGSSQSPTIELSGSDLDTTRALPEEAAPADPAKAAPEPFPEESIRIPKRRSLLPWAILILGGLVGFKLCRGAREARGPEPGGAPVTGSTVVAAPAVPSGETPVADAMASVGSSGSAVASASAAAPTPAPPSGSASAGHRPAPVKTGPANVHHLPTKHPRNGKGGRQ